LSGTGVSRDKRTKYNANAQKMWSDYKNLDKPHTDKRGVRWRFRVWHDVFTIGRTVSAARVFFWDERKNVTGVVLRGPDVNHHVRDIHALIRKLVASEEFRSANLREIRFPLERFYSEYGVFPEEQEQLLRLKSPT
jgi:hypothetical protein